MKQNFMRVITCWVWILTVKTSKGLSFDLILLLPGIFDLFILVLHKISQTCYEIASNEITFSKLLVDVAFYCVHLYGNHTR